MSDIVFGCSMLSGTGKQGILKPDKLGRYPLTVGAFNAKNKAGIEYIFDGAKKILDNPHSTFNRKMREGKLYGERGHPKRFGLKPADYADRWNTVMENNSAWQIHELLISTQTVKNMAGDAVILVNGWLVPYGDSSESTRQSFESPTMNTAASVRSVANQGMVGGIWMRDIQELITYDKVDDNGMYGSEKFLTAACEDFSNEEAYEQYGGFDGLQFTREFAEAYEHQLRVKSELHGECVQDQMAALDVIRTAAGWQTVQRLDMPVLSF